MLVGARTIGARTVGAQQYTGALVSGFFFLRALYAYLRIDKGSRGVICTPSLMSWIYVSHHIPYIHSNNYSKDQYQLNKMI